MMETKKWHNLCARRLDSKLNEVFEWYALYSSTDTYFLDEEDVEDADVGHFSYIDGKSELVFDKRHLTRAWNRIFSDKRSAQETLKTLFEVMSSLTCLDGMRYETVQGFLENRVDGENLPAWASLMLEFLTLLVREAKDVPEFKEGGAETVTSTLWFPHWMLLFAYKSLDEEYVVRYYNSVMKESDLRD
jgi:hypothetical protein